MRLRQNGHEAYLVGGCVRDLLLGHTPKDFDIATSATPQQVRDLFRNSRLIGRRFRLAHVFFKGGKILEVSTFRARPTEVEEAAATPAEPDIDPGFNADAVTAALLGDGRAGADDSDEADDDDDAVPEGALTEGAVTGEHASPAASALPSPPSAVPPSPSSLTPASNGGADTDVFITQDNVFGTEIEDARRRDFTINGLFYDPVHGKVIDHVRGMRDLALREIRTIGDPEIRLREDPVRLLRAVRFCAKLGFDIESRTYAAMEATVEDLSRCSAPRLLEETFRLIRGGHAAPSLKLLRALDALKILLPPMEEHLARGGAVAEEGFFDFVETLDEKVLDGELFDDSMLLAVLLLPLSLAGEEVESADGQQLHLAKTVELLLADLVRTARLPRRISERCRLMLLAQRTMAGLRRRRGGLVGFRRHPLFNEALRVFSVWVEATGEHEAALQAWNSGGAPTPQPGAPGPSRRRRRRGPRGSGPPPAAP
jgi:poly(A) polymerase